MGSKSPGKQRYDLSLTLSLLNIFMNDLDKGIYINGLLTKFADEAKLKYREGK